MKKLRVIWAQSRLHRHLSVPYSETAICSLLALNQKKIHDTYRGGIIQDDGTQNFCPGTTLGRSSEVQKQIDRFGLESSTRIRDVILRRTSSEKEIKITKPELTRRETKPDSILPVRVSFDSSQDADDLPATNTAANCMDFQEISSHSFRLTSQTSVAESLVHSYVKKKNRSFRWQ